ncbi:MAG: glycerol kinase GlpK [Caldisphaera sp.]
MGEKYVLAIDQGTTRSKAVIFDEEGKFISYSYKEIPRIYPHPGWVEQDPEEIWQKTMQAVIEVIKDSKIELSHIKAIGIADQGETLIMWDKNTGKPIYNAIVWQCRRTTNMIKKIKKENKNFEQEIKIRTGLILDPYFSATKVKWIIENVIKSKAQLNNILFGTTDTWLIWKLTKGRVHVTDYTTASRTMMLNIHSLKWDDYILEELKIPKDILPELHENSSIVAETDQETFFGGNIPISGVIVDQQGALFGQACYNKGDIKVTYGTGSFVLMNTGEKPVDSTHGLLTTIAWVVNKKINYALDGGVYTTGAVVQWLRDNLKIINNVIDSDKIAKSISDTNGVYFVPSFSGLAAPYWDATARGAILGLTLGSDYRHLVRAVLESIAYSVYDIIESFKNDSAIIPNIIRADGGLSQNHFLMQFQADILDMPLEVSEFAETTSLGVAYLAGLAVDLWKEGDLIELDLKRNKRKYIPKMSLEQRHKLLNGWKKAVKRAMHWEKL